MRYRNNPIFSIPDAVKVYVSLDWSSCLGAVPWSHYNICLPTPKIGNGQRDSGAVILVVF